MQLQNKHCTTGDYSYTGTTAIHRERLCCNQKPKHTPSHPHHQAFTPAPFIPATYAQEITEPAARTALSEYTRIDVDCPSFPGAPVRTAFIPPTSNDPSKPPLVALHGFDSSSLVCCVGGCWPHAHSVISCTHHLDIRPIPSPCHPTMLSVTMFSFQNTKEFRRLLPLLQEDFRAWGVDLVGWGFTSCGFEDPDAASTMTLGPDEKRAHLYAFWKQHVCGDGCVVVMEWRT